MSHFKNVVAHGTPWVLRCTVVRLREEAHPAFPFLHSAPFVDGFQSQLLSELSRFEICNYQGIKKTAQIPT